MPIKVGGNYLHVMDHKTDEGMCVFALRMGNLMDYPYLRVPLHPYSQALASKLALCHLFLITFAGEIDHDMYINIQVVLSNMLIKLLLPISHVLEQQ